MDRSIVYPGALPQDTDLLNTNLFSMVGEGFQNAAFVGTNTVVAGLSCVPTGPASLQVIVNTGSIYAVDPIDASGYGSLGINNNSVVKQGILPAPVTLTITPPGTSGFSQVYLVEAALQDIDTGSLVLSYYNSANPSQPFSGPNNSGSSNFTQRTCRCVIQLKAGVPATTGSQVAPSTDVGFVGLYNITVSNATTQITSGLIVQLPSAPFFPTLPQVPVQVQNGTYVYAGQDTGAANAYVITFAAGQPIPGAYTAGMGIKFKALNANTGASTVNVNGLGVANIRRATGVALAAADINSGQVVELTYDGTNFQMQNYLGTGANTNSSTIVGIPYVADSGTQNAIIATYSPAISSGQQVAGLVISVKLANAITGACTINVNGLGTKAVKLGDLTNPPFNTFVANMDLLLEYDGTQYQICNTSSGMFYRRPTANYTIYVNGSTGSDTLYDGTSATVGAGTSGPLATIGKAMLVAYGYAPSQFTITIQIAAGTYSESVSTPLTAGPAVIINGASAASVIISSGANNCVVVQGPNTLTVQNVTIQNAGNPNAYGFGAISGATMITSTTISNAIAASVFYANSGGTMFPGNHTFSGSCTSCFGGFFNGLVSLSNQTFTFSTSIAVSAGTALAFGGQVLINTLPGSPTFVNPSFVSGNKYNAQINGVVIAQTLGVNFLPGTVAGTTSTGGQYLP